MAINRVTIVGMGSLGLLSGSLFSEKLGVDNVEFVMDEKRKMKYSNQEWMINGKSYPFKIVSDKEKNHPAELVIFAVKSTNLDEAIETARNKISEKTLILSLLNGITSEEILGKAFGMDKVLYTVAEGMDPIKFGNTLRYTNTGYVRIGIGAEEESKAEKLQAVIELFDRTGFPYKLEKDMKHRLWSKFMLNVGVNQAVMIYEGTYGTIQKPGPARDLMIAAMKEVITLAEKENIPVTEEDLKFYVALVDTLNPDGMPSMRHDGLHRIKSEVELFSGMVLKLGKSHGVPTPINQYIYDTIKEIEKGYIQWEM